MKYAYDKTAGYYGNGAWVVYRDTCSGREVTKVFSTEQECIEYGARRES